MSEDQKDALQICFFTSAVRNNTGYIQVHYPVEAIPSIPFSDSKGQLLEAQVSSRTIFLKLCILT